MPGIWVAVKATTSTLGSPRKTTLKSWKSRPAAPMIRTRLRFMYWPPGLPDHTMDGLVALLACFAALGIGTGDMPESGDQLTIGARRGRLAGHRSRMQAMGVQLPDVALEALAGGARAQDQQVPVHWQAFRDMLDEAIEMLLAARLAGRLGSAASVAQGRIVADVARRLAVVRDVGLQLLPLVPVLEPAHDARLAGIDPDKGAGTRRLRSHQRILLAACRDFRGSFANLKGRARSWGPHRPSEPPKGAERPDRVDRGGGSDARAAGRPPGARRRDRRRRCTRRPAILPHRATRRSPHRSRHPPP